MKDIEVTTSTGRMLIIVAIMLFLSSTALGLGHATVDEIFRVMSGVLSTLALVFFLKA